MYPELWRKTWSLFLFSTSTLSIGVISEYLSNLVHSEMKFWIFESKMSPWLPIFASWLEISHLISCDVWGKYLLTSGCSSGQQTCKNFQELEPECILFLFCKWVLLSTGTLLTILTQLCWAYAATAQEWHTVVTSGWVFFQETYLGKAELGDNPIEIRIVARYTQASLSLPCLLGSSFNYCPFQLTPPQQIKASRQPSAGLRNICLHLLFFLTQHYCTKCLLWPILSCHSVCLCCRGQVVCSHVSYRKIWRTKTRPVLIYI